MDSPYAPAWNEFLRELNDPLLMPSSTVDGLFRDSERNAQKLLAKYNLPPPDTTVSTEDITLQDVWVRIYTPASPSGHEPITIFMHGGGWIMGSVDHEDAACRRMCRATRLKIVSIGYRLAPQFKFPTGLEDCVRATLWTLAQFGVGSVVLAGGSAGANLAFGVALKLIDAGLGERVKGVVALVPCTVHPDAVPADKKASFTAWEDCANSTVNTRAAMECFLEAYRPPPSDTYFSVLLHPRLKDLRKVYIVECGTDTLRDDARLMKEALEEAQVPVRYDAYPGFPHYFWSYPSPVLAAASEEFHENLFLALEWANGS
ncbi:alpha/beta hydrolase [Aspergillus clavatus NRRL 1]|uniref:Alpha/beta hydrolase fold protein n=1 Tax=Aspergillus clavatus (strain ATCC 1007 / CBS 513.65 / DSM 816 / NCTC 3887 / NRRL 1 / QM 1276 / 107) TaxID=344612 RepID=A1CCP8_ASPCL|nr:alpha/beta hydrolase fold protein [Aspergillus clavatus NRRL 1]EAW12305.1 alpha/beta hydrolase fold protein [Aspergillus clavatus NRRL 1]